MLKWKNLTSPQSVGSTMKIAKVKQQAQGKGQHTDTKLKDTIQYKMSGFILIIIESLDKGSKTSTVELHFTSFDSHILSNTLL